MNKIDKAIKQIDHVMNVPSAEEIEELGAAKYKACEFTKRRDYLKNLKPWHEKILRMVVLEGKQPMRIADELDMNLQWVQKIIESDISKERMTEMAEQSTIKEAKIRVASLADKAAQVLEEILNSTDKEMIDLKARVAKDILDRAGIREAQEQKFTYEHIFQSIRSAIEDTSQKMEEEAERTKLIGNS